MKIAMLAPASSTHTLRWCRGLISRGHEILLISNSASPERPPDIPVRFLPGQTPLAYARNIPAVRRIIRECGPDIVHAHYATGYGLWGSMQRTAPLVVSVWGTDIADATSKPLSAGIAAKRALRSARLITATSRFLLEKTIALMPETADKIDHVPFGVPIPPSGKETSERTDDSPITVVFAKAYLPNYAPDIVLRAFARAYAEIPRLRLVMIGGGEMHPGLENFSHTLGVASVAQIDGWVDHGTALIIISRGDIFVMPSHAESFGVAAVEAASYGLPVIASDVGGIPEVVQDSVTGILIPPGDEMVLAQAILRLAKDSDMRRAMGEAGRRLVIEKYDFEQCLDRMEAIYRKALTA